MLLFKSFLFDKKKFTAQRLDLFVKKQKKATRLQVPGGAAFNRTIDFTYCAVIIFMDINKKIWSWGWGGVLQKKKKDKHLFLRVTDDSTVTRTEFLKIATYTIRKRPGTNVKLRRE